MTFSELRDKEVINICENQKSDFHTLYDVNDSIEDKMNTIATEIYGADGVDFTADALKQVRELEKLGLDRLPICVAKTQYSLSDDAAKLGKPEHFTITVRDVTLSNGACFVVVLTGNIMPMPGLPKAPSALKIDCDNNGNITGLF